MNPAIQKRLDELGYFTDAAIKARDDLGYQAPESYDAAVQHYQVIYTPQLDSLTRYYHSRSSVPDGDVGPATSDLLLVVPRCDVPDFEEARTPEEANIPQSCRNAITRSKRFTLQGLSDAELEELWLLAAKNFSDVIEVGFVHDDTKYPNTHQWVNSRVLGGGTLAWQYFPQGCGGHQEGTMDSNRTWGRGLAAGTLTHELGHLMGMKHINNPLATLNPYIAQRAMAEMGKLHELDIALLVEIGYKRRTTPPDEPKPPEPPDDIIDITIWRTLKAGRYQLRQGTPGGGWSI